MIKKTYLCLTFFPCCMVLSAPAPVFISPGPRRPCRGGMGIVVVLVVKVAAMEVEVVVVVMMMVHVVVVHWSC
jgi:hypothetical protein